MKTVIVMIFATALLASAQTNTIQTNVAQQKIPPRVVTREMVLQSLTIVSNQIATKQGEIDAIRAAEKDFNDGLILQQQAGKSPRRPLPRWLAIAGMIKTSGLSVPARLFNAASKSG